MAEQTILEKLFPAADNKEASSGAQRNGDIPDGERMIPKFDVDTTFLKSLMRMQTGFEMKTLSRASEEGSANLLRSLSLTTSFVAALEQQLNNLLAFAKEHLSNVQARLKFKGSSAEEMYHLGEVLLTLQSILTRSFQELRDLAEAYDNVDDSNAASDFIQSQAALEGKNDVEDSISEELTNLHALLNQHNDTSQKSELLHRGAVSGETRKQKHGFHILGPAILLATMWLLLIFTSLFGAGQNLDLMIRFFRGQLLVVSYAYLLGLNMVGWASARIDYVHSNILPMGTVTPAHVFDTAGVLAVVFGALITLFLILSPFTNSPWLIISFAIVMWLLLFAFLINPFDVVNRGARFFFIKHTSQVVLSPLFPVLFSHVWLTDQMLSLVAVGLDLQYLSCYLIVVTWVPGASLGICSSSITVIRPLIAALPALWRILQSLRCFVETRSPRHIVNAFKYFTTIAVVVIASAIEMTQPPTLEIRQLLAQLVKGWIATWVIAATVNILYSHTWDVVMDWEAIRFNSRGLPYMRKQRLYSSLLFYYFALCSNLFFRVANALKTTLAVLRHTGHGDAIFTMLVFAELVRRFMWNFLRVELHWLKIRENLIF